ncbi:hypothetical protein [Shimazuella alba]|uniref:Uncharacterized protein n=1 Tax=Shimazuella alba TaxID=2690964 RepID=A0A6I4VXU0_9BACL|nr:hypothetical protein [Shimazuella alba]MXQ53274.1 hypothetical protein [Shimazuella alba]
MLSMYLKGECHYVEAFVTHLKIAAFFHLVNRKPESRRGNRAYFTTNLFKPSLSPVSRVELVTMDNQVIEIELLHLAETRVNEHIRQISGLSYDIFSTPKR